MASADERRVGAIIGGKWRLDRLLGAGSMAAVYAGTHRNGARAALKILHQALTADVTVCERFLGEGYLTNTVKHPGIVKVFDDGVTDEGCPYLVMDLLEGQTLEDFRVARGGKLPLAETMAISDKIMDALGAVHNVGIIHRDLKPQNLFITTHGELKLLDFGVAKQDARRSQSKGTMTGLVLGTPSFMSPEQAMAGREPVDVKSDVWALGAIMFTLLSGETVHLAGNVSARLLAAATMKARSISSVVPNLPPDIVLVVDTALQFKKEDRWQNIDAMRSAMMHVARSLPPLAEGTMLDVVIPGLDPLLRGGLGGAAIPAAPPPPASHLNDAPAGHQGSITEPAPPPKPTKPPSPVELRNAPVDNERTVVSNPSGPDGTLIGMSLEDVQAANKAEGPNVGLHKGIPAAPPRPPRSSSQPASAQASPSGREQANGGRGSNRQPTGSAGQVATHRNDGVPAARAPQRSYAAAGEANGQVRPGYRAPNPSYAAVPPARSPWPSQHNELTYPPPLDASGNPTDGRGPRFVVSLVAAVVAGVIAFGAVVAFRSRGAHGTHSPSTEDTSTPSVEPSGLRVPGTPSGGPSGLNVPRPNSSATVGTGAAQDAAVPLVAPPVIDASPTAGIRLPTNPIPNPVANPPLRPNPPTNPVGARTRDPVAPVPPGTAVRPPDENPIW